MEVLILSKTHVGSSSCVGGVVLEDMQFVRLMNGRYEYQPGVNDFEIGQIWDINFEPHPSTPPHIEDVWVRKKKFIRSIENLSSFIQENLLVWEGTPETLFDGKLNWTGRRRGYLSDQKNVPANSVGFWISQKDLILLDDKYYEYQRKVVWRSRQLPYVGYGDKLAIIPSGTLLRVSLAKWWSPNDPNINIEERCYLQLSGWY